MFQLVLNERRIGTSDALDNPVRSQLQTFGDGWSIAATLCACLHITAVLDRQRLQSLYRLFVCLSSLLAFDLHWPQLPLPLRCHSALLQQRYSSGPVPGLFVCLHACICVCRRGRPSARSSPKTT
jgi:hypothetical protein